MPLARHADFIPVEDYLLGERDSEVKHEYVDGQVYAMAGASVNHNIIVSNVSGLLWNALQGQPCFPVSSDMMVKTSDFQYRYPDVVVICDGDETGDEHVSENPRLIVEVLSNSTRQQDTEIKRREYLAMPSLQEYVLIEQDVVDVEVFRRSDDWRPTHYFMGDDVHFEAVDVTVSVEAIYQRVKNADVQRYFDKLAAEIETTVDE